MSTVEVARHGPRPAIRLRPAPRCDPPFDDEREPGPWSSPDQLAFDWPRLTRRRPAAMPSPPARPPARRTIVAGVSADAKRAVRRFVSAFVEVLNGHRPAAHLRRLAEPHEAATVVAQGLAGARRVAAQPRARARRASPVAVSRLRLCEPRAGAVEAAVVLVIADQTWALAFRLELHDEAWLATTMRLL